MNDNSKTRSIAQGPAGYPLVGNLPEFLYDKLGFLSRCAATYGM